MRKPWLLVAIACVGCNERTEHGPPTPAFVRYYASGLPQEIREHVTLELDGITNKSDEDFVEVPSGRVLAAKTLRIKYATPCGERVIELPLPDNERGYAEVLADVPPSTLLPRMTRIMFDPAIETTVELGALKLDPKAKVAPLVLDATCGAQLKIGEASVPVPPTRTSPRTVENGQHGIDDALFVTARRKQCFLDQIIGYGIGEKSEAKKLVGANAYWLHATDYSFWFRPPADEVQAKGTTTTRRAFGLCT